METKISMGVEFCPAVNLQDLSIKMEKVTSATLTKKWSNRVWTGELLTRRETKKG